MNHTELEHFFLAAVDLSKKKNHDYGSDGLIEFGRQGCLIRLSDKIHRLKNLLITNNFGVDFVPSVNESIQDTCTDICNYAAYIALWSKLFEEE